jgi:hypothetical protein
MKNEATECYRIKLKNRRVYVGKHSGGVVIKFVKLDTEPTVVTIKSNRNVHQTQLGLSFEAGIALHQLLGKLIQLSDIEKEKT